MHAIPPPTDTVTVREAAAWLRITHPTLYRLINAGRLRTFKIGSRRFTTVKWLEECRERLARRADV